MRVVVTGAGGFIGGFLVAALNERGDEVVAWSRTSIDLNNRDALFDALTGIGPDAIVHLAAQSLPARSWTDPHETYRTNVGATINLLEATRVLAKPVRLLFAGSSAEYAEPTGGERIREDGAIEPNSPYGASKAAAWELVRLYVRHYGIDVVGFRPFAFIGPRKTGDVCSDFARRVVAIERGAHRTMPVGELGIVRDMIDVRDGVDAIVRLIAAGTTGETYNVCSGQPVSIGTVLETYRKQARVPFETQVDPALLRPLEQKVKIGDPSKLEALGWMPSRSISESLNDILAYWRAHER